MLAPVYAGAAEKVCVVLSEDSASYRAVYLAMRKVLDQEASGRFDVMLVLSPAQMPPPSTEPVLIVTVGVAAASEVLERGVRGPLLATLIPRSAVDRLMVRHGQDEARPLAAITLDQPAQRMVDLARLVMPANRSRFGVIFGPDSAAASKAFDRAAKSSGVQLESETVTDQDHLPQALERLLNRSDLLLALPDPQVYNRGTLQNVLVSAYRASNPVIGFSASYVRAGALAAVYSTPEQVGKQAGETVARGLINGKWQLPPLQTPRYFSVSVNRNVARSLSVTVEDEAVLTEKLMQRPAGIDS